MLGKFQLLIKRYPAWGDPSFIHNYKPPGVMSNYIHGLKVGDSVRFKHIPFNVKKQYPFTGVRTITMLAVGVGIAPMMQALHAVLTGTRAPSQMVRHCLAWTRLTRTCDASAMTESTPAGAGDNTQVVFLYGNRSVEDILMRERLDGSCFSCARPNTYSDLWIFLKKLVRVQKHVKTFGNFFYIRSTHKYFAAQACA